MLKLIAFLTLFVFTELALCRAAYIRLSNLTHALDARVPPKAVSLANLLAREGESHPSPTPLLAYSLEKSILTAQKETTTVIVPVSCEKTTYVTYLASSTQLPGGRWQTGAGDTTTGAPSPSIPTAKPTTPETSPSFISQTSTTVYDYSAASTPSTGFLNSAASTPSSRGRGGGVGASKPSLTPTPTPSTLIPVSDAVAGMAYSGLAIGVWVLAFSFLIDI
ncbi:uncharacterized protein TRUGW13939_03873 [Talaromyces rugulosus]|uniref:Uncharacterized protein n=1 Tax=Talaromyces rugulosus TaxID=121627 RepID=A0A7H8QSE3_TALRU|nr:uncharacterized protein TRUGW13939_03873 [Talaromyces rugulosus]QKX56766.1 hypothetical protein TRUGW13939_03873 [Talaromyces rugulosus]